MMISRFSLNDEIFYGKLDQDKVHKLMSASAGDLTFNLTGDSFQLSDLTELAPVKPMHIYGVGDNYPRSDQDASLPVIFNKSPEVIVKNYSKVFLVKNKDVWPEPEIGIVLKKNSEGMSLDNFEDYILGYILVNDLTCVTSGSNEDTHNQESKSQKGFCPVGSFIQTKFDFSHSDIKSSINGIDYRIGNTKNFKWSLRELLINIIKDHKLLAGDLVITGCPSRVENKKTFLKSNDTFSSYVEGLGKLETYFQEEN